MKKRTRWYQFRMGSLLVAVTLCAAGLGWFGVKLKNARRVARVVKEIHERGGSVRFDYELSGAEATYDKEGWPQWPSTESPPLPAPKWLRRCFGDYLFCDVVAVYFYWPHPPTSHGGGGIATEASLEKMRSQVQRGRFEGESDFAFVSQLPRLQWLHLEDDSISDAHLGQLTSAVRLRGLVIDSHQISDAGLKHLGHLTSLETLSINHSDLNWGNPSPYPTGEFTDAGLGHLQALTSLRYVAIFEPQLTSGALRYLTPLQELRIVKGQSVDDEGLQYLSRLPELRELVAYGATDAGLQQLRRLTNLKRLCLSESRISDAGLAKLAANEGLDTLLLRNTRVTDDGIAHLAEMPGLEVLDLSGTGITDRGLARLAAMPALRCLILNDTQVTAKGLEQLRDVPNLKRLCVNNITAKERDELCRDLGADVQGLGVGITPNTWNSPF
jgi:Leucine-rich repeat (LRR) protein